MLKELISSRPKRKLLAIFLANPDEKFYMRQLQRLAGEPIRAIQREIPKLEKIGLIKAEASGRVKNYIVNKKCPIFDELKRIIMKTVAVGDKIKELIKDTKDIRWAFVYGSVAENSEDVKSGIDLMIIGEVDEVTLNKKIRQIESKISRTVNYSLMSVKEFKKKSRSKNAFLQRVLKGKKINLVGSLDEI